MRPSQRYKKKKAWVWLPALFIRKICKEMKIDKGAQNIAGM